MAAAGRRATRGRAEEAAGVRGQGLRLRLDQLPLRARTSTVKEMAGDVAKAIRWTHDHAREYGGDPNTIFVMGHSAGAQLAALVCTDDRYLKAEGLSLSIIKGCVPVDVAAYDMPKQIEETAETRADRPRCKNVFGDAESQKDLSPVTHVAKGKNIPPFLILHVADRPDTKAQSQLVRREAAGSRRVGQGRRRRGQDARHDQLGPGPARRQADPGDVGVPGRGVEEVRISLMKRFRAISGGLLLLLTVGFVGSCSQNTGSSKKDVTKSSEESPANLIPMGDLTDDHIAYQFAIYYLPRPTKEPLAELDLLLKGNFADFQRVKKIDKEPQGRPLRLGSKPIRRQSTRHRI